MARSRIDVGLLFATRIARLLADGLISVVLVLSLSTAGLGTGVIGLLLTLTLIGDAIISLWLTTWADRIGRCLRALTQQPLLLTLAAIVGVISPSGDEIGPFLSSERASLSQLVPVKQRTHISPGTIWWVRSPQRPAPSAAG